MFLVLDCSQRDAIHLELLSKEESKTFVHAGRQADLLLAIDLFLKQECKTIKEIEGILAVTGEGSFTSSRLGVLFGNVVHFVLGIPVATITKAQSYDYEDVARTCLDVGPHYATATYTSLPNLN